jgi:predicted phosphoadenosine phosphosulfate sulfurtransferase
LDAGGAAFADWHQSQPDAAAAWLNALPKDDPRRFPFFQQMIQSIAYSSQAAEQLAALSATDKSTAQGILANMSLAPDQRTRLLDAVKSN